MNPLDHTNAEWADGAEFLAWLASIGVRAIAVDPAWKKKLERWRSGRQACFYDIDEILVKACYQGPRHVSLHVNQVPNPIWRRYDNGRRRRRSNTAEAEVAVAA